MDRLKLALTWVIILGVMFLGFYWLSKDAEKTEFEEIKAMSHGYGYSKGVILEKHSYKGRTIHIKYRIGGIEYECKRNWDNNSRNLDVGDSISFRYAFDNHKIIFTELEKNY
jgi:uncharacterized protein (UPF0333 family)